MVDFLVITALPEELEAVRAKLKMRTPLEKQESDPDVHTYYAGDLKTARSDGTAYRVVATQLVHMGPIEAGVQTAYAIGRWQPRVVLMVGIAGGLKSEAVLGDVLLARIVADYTLGKVQVAAAKGPKKSAKGAARKATRRIAPNRIVRWEPHRADRSLFDSAMAISPSWTKKVRTPRPKKGAPVIRVGVVVSGGDVIAAKAFVETIVTDWPKLVGVEMEGGGVATAAAASANTPRFLMIRGVSDYADKGKNDPATKKWRRYACDSAATFMHAFLVSGPLPPLRKEPPQGSVVGAAPTLGAAPAPAGAPAETPSQPIGAEQTNVPNGLRARDVRALRALLSTIIISEVDYLIERARSLRIPHRIVHFMEGFRAVYHATDFHIHNDGLRARVDAFARPFLRLFDFEDYFSPVAGGLEYGFVGFGLAPEAARLRARKEFLGVVEETAAALVELVRHVNVCWIEVDTRETDAAAAREYTEFEARMDALLDDVPAAD